MSGGGFGLGNIGGALGNVVGSAIKPMNAIGSAVGSLGGAGSILGPAIQLAGGANPLGVFGASLGSQVLNDLRKSGGSADRPNFIDATGNMIYADPSFDYGKNTYAARGKPLDTSRYFISGERGMYNLLPKLGDIYLDSPVAKNLAPQKFFQNPANAKYRLSDYDRAGQAYNSIFNAMADDAKAQTEFSSRFGPKTFTYNPNVQKPNLPPFIENNPARLQQYLNNPRNAGIKQQYEAYQAASGANIPSYLQGDIRQLTKKAEQDYLAQVNRNANPFVRRRVANPLAGFAPKPITYYDFGFGPDAMTMQNPYEALANYAQAQNNPFFVGYKPAPTPAPAPAAPQPSPTGMKAGGLVALAKKR